MADKLTPGAIQKLANDYIQEELRSWKHARVHTVGRAFIDQDTNIVLSRGQAYRSTPARARIPVMRPSG